MQCKNCDIALNRKFKYCPECGQKITEDLTVKVLFSNTISNYFSVDARFFKSFVPLIFKPGFLASKFVEGKRLTYLHPAQFYLFSSVIFFFLFSIVTNEQQQKFDNSIKKAFVQKIDLDSIDGAVQTSDNISIADKKKIDSLAVLKKSDTISNSSWIDLILNFNQKKVDSLISINAPESEILKLLGLKENNSKLKKYLYSQMLKIYKKQGVGLLTAFYNTISLSLFFLLPLFALLLKLLFYKKGSYSYNLVFSFYLFSFLFIAHSLIMVSSFFGNIPAWIELLLFAAISIHLLLSLYRFYQSGFFITFLKTGVLLFLFTTFLLPLTLFFMMMTSIFVY